MTSIFKTPSGELQQFVQNLHTAGFTYEDVKCINKDPNQASLMYTAIQPSGFVQEVERQLEVLAAYGVVISEQTRTALLATAEQFVPDSTTDAPLITGAFGSGSPRSLLKKLFGLFAPAGYSTHNYIENAEIRYVSGMKPTASGIRLIHFDGSSYQGLSPQDALEQAKQDKVRLAGVEVIEYMMLDPKYAPSWNGTNRPYPNLSGLQRKYGTDWSNVPYADRVGSEFSLGSDGAGVANPLWSSPVVREC